jgi:hypothetical protein
MFIVPHNKQLKKRNNNMANPLRQLITLQLGPKLTPKMAYFISNLIFGIIFPFEGKVS